MYDDRKKENRFIRLSKRSREQRCWLGFDELARLSLLLPPKALQRTF